LFKKPLMREETLEVPLGFESTDLMPVLTPRGDSSLPELPLPTRDDDDSMSEPEQLYTNQGGPYISKRQNKH